MRSALRGALTASAEFTSVTVPLTLEKLQPSPSGTTPAQTRLDAVDVLDACISSFPLPALEPHLAAIWCVPDLKPQSPPMRLPSRASQGSLNNNP